MFQSRKGELEFLFNRNTKFRVLDGGERKVAESFFNIKTMKMDEREIVERFLKIQVYPTKSVIQKDFEEIIEREVVKRLKDLLGDCKDSKDVSKKSQEYFKNKVGCKIKLVDLQDVDLDISKDIVTKLDELDDKYDSTLTSLKARSLARSVGGECTPTTSSAYKYLVNGDRDVLETEITLNNLYLRSKKDLLKDFEVNNTTTRMGVPHNVATDEKNASIVTLVHEYGHSLLVGKLNVYLDKSGINNPVFTTAKRMERAYKKELNTLKRDIQKTRDKFVGQPNGLTLGIEASKGLQTKYNETCISKYSTASVGEFIAEAFCDGELNGNKAKKASIKLHKLLTQEYGKR